MKIFQQNLQIPGSVFTDILIVFTPFTEWSVAYNNKKIFLFVHVIVHLHWLSYESTHCIRLGKFSL